MSKSRPNNGPTFSSATIKKQRPTPPTSERNHAEMEQKDRDCAREREFHKDPAAWMRKHYKAKV
jgi:hypothetical protein